MRLGLIVALAFGPVAARAQDMMTVDGHAVVVSEAAAGEQVLAVDGVQMLVAGLILVASDTVTVAGETVVTGVAGAGGNACNAAPFVLMLGAAPKLWGPVDSCANLEASVQADAIVFAAEPVPSQPGEVWVWTRQTGFSAAPPVAFAAKAGWEALDGLAGAHPVDAMAIAPVDAALRAGLGPDYQVFAERISELGSGDLTAAGYLGEACLKFTCEADFAVLYIHKATRQVFAIWHVYGEIENHIWPADTTLWPPEAMAALRGKAGE